MKKQLISIYEYLRRRLLFLKRKFIVPKLPVNSDNKIYLNLGCGLDSSAEFINVDALPFPNIHYVQNIYDLSMFTDNSVDLVYASHVMEHIPRNKFKTTLTEWRRVLKIDGVLRLSVPNFDALVEIYQGNNKNVDCIANQVLGGQDSIYNMHYSLWNFSKAKDVLESFGFKNIRYWAPETVDHHNFSDRSLRTIDVGNRKTLFSLNVEVEKR